MFFLQDTISSSDFLNTLYLKIYYVRNNSLQTAPLHENNAGRGGMMRQDMQAEWRNPLEGIMFSVRYSIYTTEIAQQL